MNSASWTHSIECLTLHVSIEVHYLSICHCESNLAVLLSSSPPIYKSSAPITVSLPESAANFLSVLNANRSVANGAVSHATILWLNNSFIVLKTSPLHNRNKGRVSNKFFHRTCRGEVSIKDVFPKVL